jgi:hypothetical protein
MLLDIIFLLLASFVAWQIIQRVPLVAHCGLNKKTLVVLFTVKLLGGLVYYYVMMTRFYGGDCHALYLETSLAIKTDEPIQLLRRVFTEWSEFRLDENVFSTHNSKSWTDIGRQLHFRFNLLCNIATGSREIVNIVPYCTVFFVGSVALYRAFQSSFSKREPLFLMAIFLIPSVWLWCSGMHKDGFVLSFIGLMQYEYSKTQRSTSRKPWLKFCLYGLLACAMRYNIAVGLVPCMLLMVITRLLPGISVRKIFAMGLTLYAVIFFGISTIFPRINPVQQVCQKQIEFYQLDGGSELDHIALKPSVSSFVANLPIALNHVLLRPYPSEIVDAMYGISAFETYVITILIIICLWLLDGRKTDHAMIQFALCCSAVLYLLIGYIVPFHGAFIRYRSEYLPLIFSAFAACCRLPLHVEKFNNYSRKLILKHI